MYSYNNRSISEKKKYYYLRKKIVKSEAKTPSLIDQASASLFAFAGTWLPYKFDCDLLLWTTTK